MGAALGAVALLGRPLKAATGVPEAATLLVPGPEGGPAAEFGARAAQGLARGLVQAAALRVSVLGGPDGITAANRFAASTAPDGRMLLVLTGHAAQALFHWLSALIALPAIAVAGGLVVLGAWVIGPRLPGASGGLQRTSIAVPASLARSGPHLKR
jgi:hypothetical protein